MSARKEELHQNDLIEMDNSFSPQFVSEVKTLKKRIIDFVENNTLRRAVMKISTEALSPDPLLGTYFVLLIRKMEEREKSSLIKEIIKTVHEYAELHSPHNSHISNIYETTVDSLFIYGYEQGVLNTTQCIEGLVMTSDFTMRSRIDQRKWKYIRKCIPNIDYKGIRNVLRFLLESQLRRLPQSLTPEQVAELRVVEEVILFMIDRDNNLLPPLITLSEIMRGLSKQAHMLPRLSSKISKISIHFRPIADLTHVCGRSFIYPIPQHPSFVPYNSLWESDSSIQTPFVQSHHMLPYRPEHTTTYQYTLYMILRQPRGKDSFNLYQKQKPKSNWDVLLSVMICEAMAECESLAENDQIPRYQWDNIMTIVHYGICNLMINPSHFFAVLRELVKTLHYTRARDEVMWIVFQIVGTFSNNPSFDEAIPEIVKLYEVLFAGNVFWMGASDHPALMARFLAAASTWMILDGKEKLPPPNETVRSHISFITRAAETFDPKNIAMIAVLANAYRSDSKIGKQIPQIYQQHLEGTAEDVPVFQLSYGRQAVNRMTAFPVEFLGALTYRAKKTLIAQCFNCLRNFSPEKLPSPAVFDTIARISQSVDYESAAKDVVMMAHRSLHVITGGQESSSARDQCFFLFDFLCYRLPSLRVTGRHSFIYIIIGILNQISNHQMYHLLEQYLMRQWCWTSFHENIINANNIFGAAKHNYPTSRLLCNPVTSFVTPVDGKHFPFCPEIFRMSIIALMRALKITGQELQLEGSMFKSLVLGFPWPEKMTKYFPKWALDLIAENNFEHMQPNFTEIQRTVRNALNLHRSLTPQQFLLSYSNPPDVGSAHTILALIFRFLYENRDGCASIPQEFYDIIDKKNPREVVIATNYLVDFLIAEAKNEIENNQLFNIMGRILSQMVFRFNLFRADRLLISLVMHPTCDETSHIAILIVHEFCLSDEFTKRVKWFNQHVPRKEASHSEYMRKIVEYHELYPEYEIIEMMKGPQHDAHSNVHMPNYYGCLIERLLPIADFVISVTLEQHIFQSSGHLPILQSLALLYKYHPAPIQFIYSILFTMHGLIKKPFARIFVTTLKQQVEDCNLTVAFEKYNHQQVSQEKLMVELIERISTSLEFILTPPSYASKDWRTAEFGPGAQALYLACIEIMASPHSHETMVPAMINVLSVKPHIRPYNIVNLISLLLTALPEDYSSMLHNEFFNVIRNGLTEKMTFEELVFDTFEQSQLLHQTNRSLAINVISQAYWTHCNVTFLNNFARQHVPEIMRYVKTEKDLWYALRLIVPIIRRFLEGHSDTAKQMRSNPEKFGPLYILRLIFEKLGAMAEEGVEFEFEMHLCDLFYNCKYVFAGDFLRESAIQHFAKLPSGMRDRLKFYVSQAEASTSSSSSHSAASRNTSLAATLSNPATIVNQMREDDGMKADESIQEDGMIHEMNLDSGNLSETVHDENLLHQQPNTQMVVSQQQQQTPHQPHPLSQITPMGEMVGEGGGFQMAPVHYPQYPYAMQHQMQHQMHMGLPMHPQMHMMHGNPMMGSHGMMHPYMMPPHHIHPQAQPPAASQQNPFMHQLH